VYLSIAFSASAAIYPGHANGMGERSLQWARDWTSNARELSAGSKEL
jgi:hypothetical protein